MDSAQFGVEVVVLAIVARELIAAAAVGVAVIGIDDLFVDGAYFFRRFWRSLTVYRRRDRMTADRLGPPERPGAMAILVPAWDEAAVIGQMLRGALARLDHEDYRIFVGVYPNDPATAEAVAAIGDGRILQVSTPVVGPTTKADCLNHLWRAMRAEEVRSGKRFKAVVLHDAEDVVHSAELRLFDRLIERFDLVQLPVLPLHDPRSRWIGGHYLDEFAEAHGKDLVVREAMGAAVPSAGVGCAIARHALDRIAAGNRGVPFDEASLTEDYELGLKIGMLGGRGIIVRMPGAAGHLTVATREHFPVTLDAAVRQKARWLTGIALAGWDRLGWQGGIVEHYWRLRDRKAVIGALVTLLAYTAALLTGAVIVFGWTTGGATALPVLVVEDGWLSQLLLFNAGLLAWRLLMRFGCTARAYGWREGLRAPPRAVVANLISILACFRALHGFSRSSGGARPVWDKTEHRFPGLLPAE